MIAIVSVCLSSLIINIFLGRWRSQYPKMTLKWWLLIHASIPVILPLRIYLDIPKIFIPVLIGLAILGQFIGSRMMKEKESVKNQS